jgi:hypothetical protein
VPIITSGSLANGDTATWWETYDTKYPGTRKTLTPEGTVTDGNGGLNYIVTFVKNTTGVITGETTLQVLSFPSALLAGKVVLLQAQVLVGTTGVPTGKVTFTIDGIRGIKVTGTVNRYGIVTVNFPIPGNVRPGKYTIRAHYQGVKGFKDSWGQNILTVLSGTRNGNSWNR